MQLVVKYRRLDLEDRKKLTLAIQSLTEVILEFMVDLVKFILQCYKNIQFRLIRNCEKNFERTTFSGERLTACNV